MDPIKMEISPDLAKKLEGIDREQLHHWVNPT
jgi:hypothetical protein